MRGRSLLEMTWRDVLFAHWSVPPRVVESQLPAGLAVDTYDDRAYLGVVCFRMDPIKPRYAPLGLTFGECNLRTYVTPAEGVRTTAANPGSGIYFFNLDASDRLSVAVARRLFDLPYYTATMEITRRGEGVDFRSRRTHRGAPPNRFAATYRPTGESKNAKTGSIEAFLAERYRFYTAGVDGSDEGRGLAVGEIDHDPWKLSPAEATIETNTLFESNGFDEPEGEPLLHYSRELPVRAGRLRQC